MAVGAEVDSVEVKWYQLCQPTLPPDSRSSLNKLWFGSSLKKMPEPSIKSVKIFLALEMIWKVLQVIAETAKKKKSGTECLKLDMNKHHLSLTHDYFHAAPLGFRQLFI